jgi:hypothetical protein
LLKNAPNLDLWAKTWERVQRKTIEALLERKMPVSKECAKRLARAEKAVQEFLEYPEENRHLIKELLEKHMISEIAEAVEKRKRKDDSSKTTRQAPDA